MHEKDEKTIWLITGKARTGVQQLDVYGSKQCTNKWWCSKKRDAFLGNPTVRILSCWGLYQGPNLWEVGIPAKKLTSLQGLPHKGVALNTGAIRTHSATAFGERASLRNASTAPSGDKQCLITTASGKSVVCQCWYGQRGAKKWRLQRCFFFNVATAWTDQHNSARPFEKNRGCAPEV